MSRGAEPSLEKGVTGVAANRGAGVGYLDVCGAVLGRESKVGRR